MTQQEAITSAREFINRQNREQPFHPDYEYSLSAPTDYFDCWYFDFRIVSQLGVPKKSHEMFSGAPGFTVSKTDKSITVIDWDVYRKLPQREALFQQASMLADTITSGEPSLPRLRKHFTLPLAELILLKRSLEAPNLTEVQKKELLISRLMQEAEQPS